MRLPTPVIHTSIHTAPQATIHITDIIRIITVAIGRYPYRGYNRGYYPYLADTGRTAATGIEVVSFVAIVEASSAQGWRFRGTGWRFRGSRRRGGDAEADDGNCAIL